MESSRSSGFDWVQLSFWKEQGVRASSLVVVGLGMLGVGAAKVLLRLLREFRDTSLALLLERRFPKELGDRLITAVELTNVKAAARYGYSPAMIEQTIHDAAARVETLPVQQVFNWKRLRWQCLLAGILTAGVYVVTSVVVCTIGWFQRREAVLDSWHRFHDVVAIWFERNILLQNTIWPRNAFLDCPGPGHRRVTDWPQRRCSAGSRVRPPVGDCRPEDAGRLACLDLGRPDP